MLCLLSQTPSYVLNPMPGRVTLPWQSLPKFTDSQRCVCVKGGIIDMNSRYGAPSKAPLSSAPLIALKPFAQARSRLHDRPICPVE